MAPRSARCSICREVKAVEHVALLLWDEDLGALPPGPAIDYLKSIGMGGNREALVKRVATHRKHIDGWIDRGMTVMPVMGDGNIVRVPPPTGDTRWIDVNQNAMSLGNEALRDLAARLSSGEMETAEVIALARLGVAASQTRGALEQKGKALTGIDRLLQLAAGRGSS